MDSKNKNLNINEVARLAGVSKKSVSRVLNEQKGVSDATREHIKSIMAEVGYQPSRQARALASAQSFLLGLAYNNQNPSYVLDLLNGSQLAANALGYEIVMHRMDANNRAVDEIISFMRRSGCDGLILTPPLSESASIVAKLCDEGWPVVRIAGDNADFPMPQIRYNDRTAALKITNQLIAAGHSAIAFIGGPANAGPTLRRLAGVRDAMALNDLNLNDADIQYGDFTFESGRRCAELLLAQEQRPSAVICANDEMAAGVFQAAAALELTIPRDLSVTGFDNSPVASHLWPPLTSVRQPVQEMTALAVELLVNPKDQTEAIQQFEAQVVTRASTAHTNS